MKLKQPVRLTMHFWRTIHTATVTGGSMQTTKSGKETRRNVKK